jgi:hypothetical protein
MATRQTQRNGRIDLDSIMQAEAPAPCRAPRPSKPGAARKARPTKAETTAMGQARTLRRRVALAVAGVATSVLALSVVHCTEAVALLTGAPTVLACLLAVGIDAGMVACEFAELIGHDVATRRWALAYVVVSIGLSMGLNAYAFAQHASIPWAGACLGVIIPALVAMLGRVAGHLARD